MVSKLYNADKFYQMQKEGKIAKPYSKSQKLNKDNHGYFLNRKSSTGDLYKQRVKSTDLLYTRTENGVTLYSYKKDKDVLDVATIHKSTGKQHNPYKHVSDREAFLTNRRYKE